MNIAVIDYGTGNLHSLIKALELGGATVRVVSDVNAVGSTHGIVLPGVGAFDGAAVHLASGTGALKSMIAAGVPVLGICLGMQLLFERSEEGTATGLSVLGGQVRHLSARRLPHIGWNDVDMFEDPLFAGLDQLMAYYANSYYVEPIDDSDVIAWTEYGAHRFPAAIRRDRVWGVQFHPEKSGAPGLRLIRNFLEQLT
jgi:imidazole glycerol-phosphate synthase subunit HisH